MPAKHCPIAGLVFLLASLSSMPPGAGAATLPVEGDMAGTPGAFVVTREVDTLARLARRHDLGFVELRAANPGVDAWLPGAGVRLALPTAHLLPAAPRRGIVVNVGDQRLYHFSGDMGTVATYPIGTSRLPCGLPLGETRIVKKRTDPVWVPPASIRAERPELPRAIPPGPDNPLGRFALDLGWPGYVIHGTNKPLGIGRRVSHGCVRMYPEDIEGLFAAVAVGTRVTVIDQPVKIGRRLGELYIEVHPSPSQTDEIEATGRFTPAPIEGLETRVRFAAGADAERVDWSAVRRAAEARQGLPVRVTR